MHQHCIHGHRTGILLLIHHLDILTFLPPKLFLKEVHAAEIAVCCISIASLGTIQSFGWSLNDWHA